MQQIVQKQVEVECQPECQSPSEGRCHCGHIQTSQLNKKKRISKGKLGRPSKKSINSNAHIHSNQLQMGQSPQIPDLTISTTFWEVCDNIRKALFNFFDKTNFKKGLLGDKEIRKKLKKEQNDFWNQDQRWDPKEEEKKIRYLTSLKEFSQYQRKEIEKVLINTSGIFTQEFTKEYYRIILNLYSLILKEREGHLFQEATDNPFDDLADSIHLNNGKREEEQYYLFSYDFLLNPKLKLKEKSFKKPADSGPYRTLIQAITDQLRKLLN